MTEIGGYIELERFRGSLYHDDAVALNCGRNCLAYIIAARGVERILLPSFLCDSVSGLCAREGVTTREYRITESLQPEWSFGVEDGEYLYLVDYYGQLSAETLARARALSGGRLIVDETQNYFAKPSTGVDTLYSCRKYFGVPDGGFLYTDAPAIERVHRSESRGRVDYLVGRLERSAGEFFEAARANNDSFASEPVRAMSRFTENMLRGIDYRFVADTRNDNYDVLARRLDGLNGLALNRPNGPFVYPLLVDGGERAKKALAEKGIFVPTLWPNVLGGTGDPVARRFARDILPLPVDQRYGRDEMLAIVDALEKVGVI